MRPVTTLLCTRRRYYDGNGNTQLCPGAVGFCEGCPHVPEAAECRACGAETRVLSPEHANRVTGGWGCGRVGCPPAGRLATLMGEA